MERIYRIGMYSRDTNANGDKEMSTRPERKAAYKATLASAGCLIRHEDVNYFLETVNEAAAKVFFAAHPEAPRVQTRPPYIRYDRFVSPVDWDWLALHDDDNLKGVGSSRIDDGLFVIFSPFEESQEEDEDGARRWWKRPKAVAPSGASGKLTKVTDMDVRYSYKPIPVQVEQDGAAVCAEVVARWRDKKGVRYVVIPEKSGPKRVVVAEDRIFDGRERLQKVFDGDSYTLMLHLCSLTKYGKTGGREIHLDWERNIKDFARDLLLVLGHDLNGVYGVAADPENDSITIKALNKTVYKDIKIGLGLKSRGCDEIVNLRFGLR